MDYNLDYFRDSVLSKRNEIEVVDKLLANRTVYELFENMSIVCDDIVIGCRLNGKPVANCCERIQSYHTREGPCFYLELLDNYFQKRPGRIGGFRIDLYFPDDDIIPTVFNSFYQQSLLVYSNPFAAALARDPVIVALGEYSIMRFHATRFSNMPGKRKPCVNQESNGLKYFADYKYEEFLTLTFRM